MHSVLDRPLRASCFYMAETTSVPRFERIRDPQRSIVIHSYCLTCGLFVAANEDGYIVLRAEMAHSCQALATGLLVTHRCPVAPNPTATHPTASPVPVAVRLHHYPLA